MFLKPKLQRQLVLGRHRGNTQTGIWHRIRNKEKQRKGMMRQQKHDIWFPFGLFLTRRGRNFFFSNFPWLAAKVNQPKHVVFSCGYTISIPPFNVHFIRVLQKKRVLKCFMKHAQLSILGVWRSAGLLERGLFMDQGPIGKPECSAQELSQSIFMARK